MADYWGLEAIARRMSATPNTIRAWFRDHGFLMYQRQRAHRRLWYTNDQLITAWEIARAKTAREAWRREQA